MSNKVNEIEIDEQALETTIEPEMIVMNDDADMPQPQTNTYESSNPTIKCKPKFLNMFNKAVGELPYATVLKNSTGDQIKLIDLVKYIEANSDNITVDEMDKIISFLANINFKYVRSLMELIENQEQQSQLWEIVS